MDRQFRNFKLGEVFDIHTPKKKFNANTVKFDGHHPYVARSAGNNGIRGYIDEDEKYLNPGNTLSFGQDTATVFYQEKPYFTGDKIKIFELKGHTMNHKIGLYFVKVVTQAFSLFSWGQTSFNESVLKEVTVQLPIKDGIAGQIDFDYMEAYINELEQDCISELDTYLKAAGLNDCGLSDEDKRVLSEKRRYKEYKITDIFKIVNTHSILQSQIIENSGEIPYLTAAEGNNAVSTYISCDKEWIDEGNCIFIGGKTMTITYQEENFCSNDSHNLALYLKDDTRRTKYIQCFIVSALRKTLGIKYYWGDSISKRKIQADTVFLPVTDKDEIDFDYMETYMHAIEKEVIADAVKYKDEIMETTKTDESSEVM